MAGGGPKTPEGKAASSRNAITHGLLAKDIVVGDERIEDWELFRNGCVEALRPEGPYEHSLAQAVAEAMWRLRRGAPAEREFFERYGWAWMHIGSNLDTLIRFEARVSRQLSRHMRDLEALQDRRLRPPRPVLLPKNMKNVETNSPADSS